MGTSYTRGTQTDMKTKHTYTQYIFEKIKRHGRPLQKSIINQNSVLWNPVLVDTSTRHFSTSVGSGNIFEREVKSPGIREFAVRLYILGMSDITFIRSYKHGCLNMSQTRTTPKDMPK